MTYPASYGSSFDYFRTPVRKVDESLADYEIRLNQEEMKPPVYAKAPSFDELPEARDNRLRVERGLRGK